jgi:hypothetical protein
LPRQVLIAEEDLGFWLEMLIGMAVMILLVVLMGPGLWSSRVNLRKPDDAPKPPAKNSQQDK